jgi:hypothetical protein
MPFQIALAGFYSVAFFCSIPGNHPFSTGINNCLQSAFGRPGVKVTTVLQHSIITAVTTSTKVELLKMG